MQRVFVLAAFALLVSSCSPDSDTADNKCATNLFPSYNPKSLNQCVAVCIQCNRGTTTTCSTSCNLKGAR